MVHSYMGERIIGVPFTVKGFLSECYIFVSTKICMHIKNVHNEFENFLINKDQNDSKNGVDSSVQVIVIRLGSV